jgi:protein-tyrosine kinase
MSRFYDVLKEASRSHVVEPHGMPDASENVRRGETPARREPGPDPAVSSDAGIARSGTGASRLEAALQSLLDSPVAPEPETSASMPNSESEAKVATAESVSEGLQARVQVDLKARLLPNVADAAVGEHYRRLRTKILEQQQTKLFRSLVITSASPQEGKTVTVLNLAFSLALVPSFRVLVVDADLRRGTIGKWLGIEKNPGLNDLIEGTAGLTDVIVRCDNPSIHVLPRGLSNAAAGELLTSPDLGRHFRRIAEDFDLVLVDSPPVNLVADTRLIAAHCDAVLLLARAFSTTRKALEEAAQELRGTHVIGTVLNGAARSELYRRKHGYYYYH